MRNKIQQNGINPQQKD